MRASNITLVALALILALAAAATILALPAEGEEGSGFLNATDPIKTTDPAESQNVVNPTLSTEQEQLAAAGSGLASPQAEMTKKMMRATGANIRHNPEGYSVRLDPGGCYDVKGPDNLSLKLCEDDKNTRKALPTATVGSFVSWVNRSIVNTGVKPVCKLALASPNMDPVNDAVKTVPSNLPVARPKAQPNATIDLAPGETLAFAFLLPYDNIFKTSGVMGVADTLTTCDTATKKLSPPLRSPPAQTVTNVNKKLAVDGAGVKATEPTAGVEVEEATPPACKPAASVLGMAAVAAAGVLLLVAG